MDRFPRDLKGLDRVTFYTSYYEKSVFCIKLKEEEVLYR